MKKNFFSFLTRKKTNVPDKYTLFPVHFSSRVYNSNIDAASFSAINLIASSFAGLSLNVYDSFNHTKQLDNPVYKVLNNPNIDDTKFNFYYQLIIDYYFSGNVYLYKAFDSDGKIISIFRIDPANVSIIRDELGRKTFDVVGKVYTSDEILHIPSRYGYDEYTGKGSSIFKACSDAFNISNQMNEYTKSLFDNGMGKRAVIDISKAFPNATNEQIQQIREKFKNEYSGLDNAGAAIVKTNNIEFSTIDSGLPENRNQQLIENREFSEKQVLKIFGIPADYLEKSPENIETSCLSFIENCIKPLALQFQQSFEKLFSIDEMGNYYVEYNFNSLLKTSLTEKIDAYTKQINNGILSVNDVLRMENLPELSGGSENAGNLHFVAANLMPLTDNVTSSYMAKAQAEMNNLQNKDASGIGDDKK